MSLLASFMSAITILGTPAEIVVYGTQYWIICKDKSSNQREFYSLVLSRYQLCFYHLLHSHIVHADVCQNGCY